MQLQSYYWNGATVPAADREAMDRLFNVGLPTGQRKEALVKLLRSDSVVARGIALDFYCISNANLRFGNEPMIDDTIDVAVREAALRELERPPYERTETEANPRRGANHASALGALSHNADPADASLLARVLRENDDEQVLQEGVNAAEPVLRGEPAHTDLIAVLLDISRRHRLNQTIRSGAVAAIGASADEEVVPLLVGVLTDPELAVSASAARALLNRDVERYRPLVEPVAAGWQAGDLPPYDVHEVRRTLEGE